MVEVCEEGDAITDLEDVSIQVQGGNIAGLKSEDAEDWEGPVVDGIAKIVVQLPNVSAEKTDTAANSVLQYIRHIYIVFGPMIGS